MSFLGVLAQRVRPAVAVMVRVTLVAAVLLLADLTPQSVFFHTWTDRAVQENDYDRARHAYSRLLERDGHQPAVYERLVTLSLETRRYDDARIYLFALADLDGWTTARQRQLEIILTASGEETQAAALRVLLARDQRNPAILFDVARQQIARLDWIEARRTLEDVITAEPDHANALYWLGLLLAPQDQTQAEQFLGRAAANPDYLAQVERVRGALAHYSTDPLTDAHTFLGVTLVELGEWPFAEQAFLMALDVNAVNPTALAYLGFVRDQQGRDGLVDLLAARDMSPADPMIYYLLGQHWRLAEDYEAAYDAFSQAQQIAPQNPALAVELGSTLQAMGDLAGAEEWFGRAVELAPGDGRWYVLRANFYADTGFQLDGRGFVAIEEAAQLVPGDPDAHASLGWASYQRGEYARAYEALNVAVSINPDHARSRYYFGIVLEFLGDREGAVASYRAVVDQLGPDEGFGLFAARALDRLGYTP